MYFILLLLLLLQIQYTLQSWVPGMVPLSMVAEPPSRMPSLNDTVSSVTATAIV